VRVQRPGHQRQRGRRYRRARAFGGLDCIEQLNRDGIVRLDGASSSSSRRNEAWVARVADDTSELDTRACVSQIQDRLPEATVRTLGFEHFFISILIRGSTPPPPSTDPLPPRRFGEPVTVGLLQVCPTLAEVGCLAPLQTPAAQCVGFGDFINGESLCLAKKAWYQKECDLFGPASWKDNLITLECQVL
jgi:hypothetical protein